MMRDFNTKVVVRNMEKLSDHMDWERVMNEEKDS